MPKPLMPKATAVWLVENTSLTFEQIAEFCGLHPLEVKAIADGEVALGIRGLDPIGAGILTREEIERCQKDPNARLRMVEPPEEAQRLVKRRGPRYTPLVKRHDRPDAIAWLLRHHPELSDQQICKLIGTTKATVQAVRERTHWKSQDLNPRDPVLLGLCTQTELEEMVAKARAEKARREAEEARRRQQQAAAETDVAASLPVEPASGA